MKRPLIFLAPVFSSGIAIAEYTDIPFGAFYIAGVLSIAAAIIFFGMPKSFSACLSLAVLLLGAANLKNFSTLSGNNISRFAYYRNDAVYIVSGIIKSRPERTKTGSRFLLESKSVRRRSMRSDCRGLVMVNLPYRDGLEPGAEVALTGRLYRPSSAFAGFNYRDYLARKGAYCLMSAKTSRLLKPGGFCLSGFAFRIKEKIEQVVRAHLSEPASGIMLAMVLGERGGVSALISDTMIKTGTVHILVVSGFNVGIVAFISVLFLKILRIGRRVRYVITIFILVIYCLMTGSSNPVVRATVMGIFFLCALFLEREADICNALCLALLYILLINPRQLFDIGFQLSFASVFAIVSIHPRLCLFLRIASLKNKIAKYILQSISVSLSAWVGTVGFIAYYFRIFSPATVAANLFAVPLAALITLCGFSLVLTASLFPGLSPYVASVGELAAAVLLKFNGLMARIPGAYFYLPG
jgi:competence protein ComEC